ncbi:hypothetical protein QE152_g37316 [Popillia japonica]|uniref:Uncharacterized protein n=1 Tax=Popillia japonica TaxID=7064 RepID=A0AAW1I9Z5_POPJA
MSMSSNGIGSSMIFSSTKNSLRLLNMYVPSSTQFDDGELQFYKVCVNKKFLCLLSGAIIEAAEKFVQCDRKKIEMAIQTFMKRSGERLKSKGHV